jgi:cytochrome bd-type quinol oxidase subunit 2
MMKLLPIIWISLGVYFLFLKRKRQIKNEAYRVWWVFAGAAFIIVGCADLLEVFIEDYLAEHSFYSQFLFFKILVLSLFIVALVVMELIVRKNKRDSKKV